MVKHLYGQTLSYIPGNSRRERLDKSVLSQKCINIKQICMYVFMYSCIVYMTVGAYVYISVCMCVCIRKSVLLILY